MPNYTDNLRLEKPLQSENYNIDIFNANADKIDSAIQEVKGQVSGLELTAERVSIADPTNKFEATNVEDALLENKTSILNNTELANRALNKANEAFQRGDNVKTQLVDKLISEGLNVSTNNSFEELIENIDLGKKWASGSLTPSFKSKNFTYANMTTRTQSMTYIELNLNALNFIPTVVILYSFGENAETISVLCNAPTSLGISSPVIRVSRVGYASANTVGGYCFLTDDSYGTKKINMPISYYNKFTEFDWIAFE